MSGTRLLALVFGFWLLMRAVNKDATGRTLVDRLIGNASSKSPLLDTAGAAAVGTAPGSSSTPGAGSVLKSLFPASTPITLKRQDQGRDLDVPAGTPVLAPGSGVVLRNGSDPHGFGDSYPIVKFSSGPWAGLDVYIGHVKSLLSPGQQFSTGTPLGMTQGGTGPFVGNATTPGWAEIGRAPGGNPGPMMQPLLPGL